MCCATIYRISIVLKTHISWSLTPYLMRVASKAWWSTSASGCSLGVRKVPSCCDTLLASRFATPSCSRQVSHDDLDTGYMKKNFLQILQIYRFDAYRYVRVCSMTSNNAKHYSFMVSTIVSRWRRRGGKRRFS